MSEEYDFTTQEGREQAARDAMENPSVLESVVEALSGKSRSKRQRAATTCVLVALEAPELLKPYAADIADALNRPEGQTRWEALNTLDLLGKAGQKYGDDVIADAEDALYDETSGVVREAAFRFFCGYGSVSPGNSDKVWPLIDEAVQCYHGNPEFNDMLTALTEFADGQISAQTAAALAERMKFDAENASGTLRMRAEQIVGACKKKA